MDRWAGKVTLVTGASAGIGTEIVKELAKNGMKVIAVARRLNKLQELARSIKREYKIDVYPIQCDVQKEEDIVRAFKWANEELGGVDVLINNAGVIHHEPILGKLRVFLLVFCFYSSFIFVSVFLLSNAILNNFLSLNNNVHRNMSNTCLK